MPWAEETKPKIITTARVLDCVLVPVMDLLVEWDHHTTSEISMVVSVAI